MLRDEKTTRQLKLSRKYKRWAKFQIRCFERGEYLFDVSRVLNLINALKLNILGCSSRTVVQQTLKKMSNNRTSPCYLDSTSTRTKLGSSTK